MSAAALQSLPAKTQAEMPVPQERIRLLEILTSFQIGGTERQVVNLLTGLDSSQFDLHVGCLRRVGELLPEVERLAVPVTEFRIGRKLISPKTFWEAVRLARYIRKHRIQLVHTFCLYANMFAVPVARLAGAKFVVASIRDMGDILTPWQSRLQRWACRFADCVLVNAEAIRARLVEQGYVASKIVVIRNGINLPVRAVKSGRMVSVFSRINPMKGIDYFLDAAALLVPRFPDVRFVVAGDGAIRKQLEERARNLGLGDCVRFTGFRTDIPDLLSQTAVSVLPSLSEGLSNTLLESMAAGLPVVATRVGGNPEVVEDGVSGLLVPPRDTAALADAIARLLDDEHLACCMGSAGARRVAEMFSVEKSVAETQSFYRQLLEVSRNV